MAGAQGIDVCLEARQCVAGHEGDWGMMVGGGSRGGGGVRVVRLSRSSDSSK